MPVRNAFHNRKPQTGPFFRCLSRAEEFFENMLLFLLGNAAALVFYGNAIAIRSFPCFDPDCTAIGGIFDGIIQGGCEHLAETSVISVQAPFGLGSMVVQPDFFGPGYDPDSTQRVVQYHKQVQPGFFNGKILVLQS